MRILGIGLLIALFASALGAGSALAKDPSTKNTLAQFKNCPYENTELKDCFLGRTAGGTEGGFFQYGKVMTKLSGAIVIQGGFKGNEEEIEVSNPTGSAKLLESPPEPIVKGLKVITPEIQTLAEWPAALKASFKEAAKNKETKAFATIEMAGDECTTVPGCLDTSALLEELTTPPAFRLALKVTVTNPWLEKLGGGPCQIGSDEQPIKQNLVTSGTGSAGSVEFNETFTVIAVTGTALTDAGWHISKEQGAKGCGGEYEAYVDRALNIALEVESSNGNELVRKTGYTFLKGDLFDGNRKYVQKQHEEGNPELP